MEHAHRRWIESERSFFISQSLRLSTCATLIGKRKKTHFLMNARFVREKLAGFYWSSHTVSLLCTFIIMPRFIEYRADILSLSSSIDNTLLRIHRSAVGIAVNDCKHVYRNITNHKHLQTYRSSTKNRISAIST